MKVFYRVLDYNKILVVFAIFWFPITNIITASNETICERASNITAIDKDTTESSDTLAFIDYEIFPYFPGGEEMLSDYIKKNLKYPDSTKHKVLDGRVTLRFQINSNGQVRKIKVIRGLSPAYDKAAVLLLKKMPNWIPGRIHGHNTSFYYTIPIIFKRNVK